MRPGFSRRFQSRIYRTGRWSYAPALRSGGRVFFRLCGGASAGACPRLRCSPAALFGGGVNTRVSGVFVTPVAGALFLPLSRLRTPNFSPMGAPPRGKRQIPLPGTLRGASITSVANGAFGCAINIRVEDVDRLFRTYVERASIPPGAKTRRTLRTGRSDLGHSRVLRHRH